METHTQIIEFFGVPASGKSTIVNRLVDSSEKNIISYRQLTKDFKNASVLKKVGSIPIVPILQSILLTQYIKEKGPKFYSFRLVSLWKSLICYQYARKYSSYNRIYVDHGIIQGIVSLICGSDLTSKSKFNTYTKSILSFFKDVSFVYCNIDIDEAISRLWTRGPHDGRFEHLGDYEEIKEEYLKEEQRFRMLSVYCTKCTYIDSCGEFDNIYQQLIENDIASNCSLI